eukprot:4186511-Pleurochrysis_carterae.AAC.1
MSSVLLGRDPAVAQLFSFTGLPAVYTVLSSLYHSQRVPAPESGSNALKRFANIVTRKGGGERVYWKKSSWPVRSVSMYYESTPST